MAVEFQEDEATRDTLELLYHVSRELAAALDLHTVLRRVVLLCMRNIGAVSGSIIVLDDSGQPVDSVIIIGDQILEHTTEQLRITFEHGLAGWVARHQQAVLLADTSQDERWMRRPDDEKERTGPKSAVSAPLMARERLIGVITIVHPRPGSFSDRHLALIQAIADQAGIAVLNARLYYESQRQARAMTAVAESAAVITASLALKDVLQRILEQISHALRVEVVSLALIDPKDQSLTYQASTAGEKNKIIGLRLKLGQGIAGWVAQEGQGVIIPEARKDPRFSLEVDHLTGIETRAVACAPITSQGKVIGTLEARNPVDEAFDADALLVLKGIANLAGTAIRHAQLFERLQAAHQRYRELFEDSIDPILITDPRGLILETNRPAELATNYSNHELQRMSIDQLHALDKEQLGEGFARLTSAGTVSYESTLQTKNGRQVPVQVYVRSLWIDGIPHLQWILRDISERKNLDSMRDDLISMIYHDLRSPLANVVSSLDVFEAMLPVDSDPAFRSLLKIAIRSTERIQRLTNSLLDMNRLEAGQPIGNLFATNPVLLASDAMEAIQPIAENKGLHLELALNPDLPPVLVDADMIRRVLSNLLENAVKFTPPGGSISLGAVQEGDYVRLWVQDSGLGIPQEDWERIFDKFTRLNSEDSPKGFGLGLAYCRLAIEGHGGRIWVEGQPGEGARFCFTLPLASRREQDQTGSP